MTSNTTTHKCPTQRLITHQAQIKIYLGTREQCRLLTELRDKHQTPRTRILFFPHVNTTKYYNQKKPVEKHQPLTESAIVILGARSEDLYSMYLFQDNKQTLILQNGSRCISEVYRPHS